MSIACYFAKSHKISSTNVWNVITLKQDHKCDNGIMCDFTHFHWRIKKQQLGPLLLPSMIEMALEKVSGP